MVKTKMYTGYIMGKLGRRRRRLWVNIKLDLKEIRMQCCRVYSSGSELGTRGRL